MASGSEDPSLQSGVAVVGAARADRHDVRRLARSERLAGALWPVPTLFGVAALLAAGVTVALDDRFHFHVAHNRFLVGDTGTALTLTSVVATGMLAFLGIVFATTLVAIQLAASQYSPRAVRVFVRSRLTKVSLGIFVATFVYSIVTLIAIRSAQGRDQGLHPGAVDGGRRTARGRDRSLRSSSSRMERRDCFASNTSWSGLPTRHDRHSTSRSRPVATLSTSSAPNALPHRWRSAPADTASSTLLTLGASRPARGDVDGWIEVTRPIGSYVGAGSVVALVHSIDAARGAGDPP